MYVFNSVNIWLNNWPWVADFGYRLSFISTARGLRPRSTGPATSSPPAGSPPWAPGPFTSDWRPGTGWVWPRVTRVTTGSSLASGTSLSVSPLTPIWPRQGEPELESTTWIDQNNSSNILPKTELVNVKIYFILGYNLPQLFAFIWCVLDCLTYIVYRICISYIYLNVLSTSIIIAKLYDLPLGISKFEISILIFLLEELNSEQSVENEPKLAGPGEGSQIMSEYSDMAGGKEELELTSTTWIITIQYPSHSWIIEEEFFSTENELHRPCIERNSKLYFILLLKSSSY